MEEKITQQAFETQIEASTKLKQSGQYLNLIVKDYPKRNEVGLQPGQFITVRKPEDYAEAYKKEKSFTNAQGRSWTSNMYMCSVMVGDQKASFITFKDDEGEEFNGAGGVGEEIQIGLEEFMYQDKNGKKIIDTRLRFRPAQ